MPRLSEFQSSGFLEDVRHLMDQDNLDSCTFNDPFTRFLKTIGPQNSSFIQRSFIQRLQFDGPLHLPSEHSPDHDIEHTALNKGFNILWYLRAYSHFMKLYCPDVRYLGIGILDFGKPRHFRWRWAAYHLIFYNKVHDEDEDEEGEDDEYFREAYEDDTREP